MLPTATNAMTCVTIGQPAIQSGTPCRILSQRLWAGYVRLRYSTPIRHTVDVEATYLGLTSLPSAIHFVTIGRTVVKPQYTLLCRQIQALDLDMSIGVRACSGTSWFHYGRCIDRSQPGRLLRSLKKKSTVQGSLCVSCESRAFGGLGQ